MTKELLISMYVNALNHANYFKTDRKISWNGESKELRLDDGVIKINKILTEPDPSFNIIFFPHVNYAQKNNLGTNAFDFSLSHQEFFDLEMLFDNPPQQRRKINSKEIEAMTEKNIEPTHLQAYQKYKESYPDLSDAEIIERIGNELSDKVETIGKLLEEKNQLSEGCIVDRVAVRNAVERAEFDTFVWHDADKVFPEFDKEILGYYEIESGDLTHRVHAICKLKSIHEDRMGKHPCYQEGGSTVPLLFWTELNDCPFTSMDKQTKNQENGIN